MAKDKAEQAAIDKAEQEAKDKAIAVHTEAVAELHQKFVANEWGNKIGQCRGGSGTPPLKGNLPVLALHNNEKLTLEEFQKVRETGPRLPKVPGTTKPMPNPSLKKGEHASDFLLVTDPTDFSELSKTRNIVLQANPIPADEDDGSLSVALADQRFINVEKEGREHDKPVPLGGGFVGPDAIYKKNYAMAAEALDQLGVPEGPCANAPSPLTGPKSTATAARQATTVSTDEPLLSKEALPTTPPKGCTLFKDQAGLDGRRDEWTTKINRMPLQSIINWIVGAPNSILKEAEAEVKNQRKCMIEAMRASLKKQKLKLPKGDIIKSEVRSFAQQRDIWTKKFNFDTSKEFGHISTQARTKCLLPASDKTWNPKNPDHRICWGKDPLPTDSKVSPLTDEEKEQEILMTSSAPGVSRHHAGTDFDLGKSDKDLEPEAWMKGGRFAEAYRWLAPNAATFGFMQPFDTKGGYGVGYTAERWHWSYYPIAQALLDFTKLHQAEIEAELKKHWSPDQKGTTPRPEFKFIWNNWKNYTFNVEQQAIF